MKTKINAQIVAHSINQQGDELISVLVTFPRIILAEVNTHRMLSKNTSSSRAIPFNKMVETIQNDPFIPIAWQKDHKGMQGTEYITDPLEIDNCKTLWLMSRDHAVGDAERLDTVNKVTKQLCNRLLEPFMWTTMLITGPKSGWDNFFNLRCPQYDYLGTFFKSKKDCIRETNASLSIEDELTWLQHNKGQAEIHMMALAECIWDAYNESTPKLLIPGEWHIPFEDKMTEPFSKTEKIGENTVTWFPNPRIDNGAEKWIQEQKVKVSVAMAARTSYTVVGEEKGLDYEAMIALHDKLLAQDPPHSSPLEHCARCMSKEEYQTFLKGIIQDQGCELEQYEEGYSQDVYIPLATQGWCNNFKGFIPYRYMVDNGKID